MLQNFAKYIECKWEIPSDAAFTICSRYENGNSIYFLSEYVPNLSVLGIDRIAEIYHFLDLQVSLEPLRDSARKTLQTAGKYEEISEENISLSISKVEIDDIVAAYRINSQSKGRAAIAKGLEPLADLFAGEYYGDVEKEAEKYIDKSKGLETAEDVISGVVAILTDRFAFNEKIRIAVRDLTIDEGHFDVSAKKKTSKFDKFKGNGSNISEEDIVFLRYSEKNGDIKLSLSTPDLYALEAMKQLFLKFENSASAAIVNRAISDAWIKFLSPMAQNSVKEEIFENAVEFVSRKISAEIREVLKEKLKSPSSSTLIISQNSEIMIDIIVVNNNGEVLRVSTEDVRNFGKAFNSTKIRNIFEQWRASEVIIVENPNFTHYTKDVIELTIASFDKKPNIRKIPPVKKSLPLLKNEFVKKQIESFDKDIQNIYAAGIIAIAPFGLIHETDISKTLIDNPAIEWIGDEKLNEIIDRNLILLQLQQGIEIGEKNDNLLLNLGIKEDLLSNLRKAKKDGTLKCKNDLAAVDGMSDLLFSNISGFVIFPKSSNILDRTLVNHAMFDLTEAMCSTLNTNIEDMIQSEDLVSFYKSDNNVNEFFICKKMAKHLNVGAKYLSLSNCSHSRIPWHEIIPGTTMYGKVRNSTNFGIFVDINAPTDGLIHISEVPPHLAHSLETFVRQGDKVRVKVLEVNQQKRRISLSMNFQQFKIPELLQYFNENL